MRCCNSSEAAVLLGSRLLRFCLSAARFVRAGATSLAHYNPSCSFVVRQLISCFLFFFSFFFSFRPCLHAFVSLTFLCPCCFLCCQMFTMVLSRDMSSFVQQTYVSISEWTEQAFFLNLCCPSSFCNSSFAATVFPL